LRRTGAEKHPVEYIGEKAATWEEKSVLLTAFRSSQHQNSINIAGKALRREESMIK
jgi:hypothetical protein